MGRGRVFFTTCGVQKNGIYVGGCKMGRVRAIHTKCGVPQNGILTYILLTYSLTQLLTYLLM